MLDRLADRQGLVLNRLEMEVTEAALLENPKEARATVEAVRKLGMRVALDDFGIGFEPSPSARDRVRLREARPLLPQRPR